MVRLANVAWRAGLVALAIGLPAGPGPAISEPLWPDPTQSTPAEVSPGERFRDVLVDGGACGFCPLMTVLPAGAFTMGSPSDEPGRHGNEGPQRVVTLARPFAIGVYEVTFTEWDACVAAGGCHHPGADEEWGRGDRPAISLSWSDAQDFTGWLSAQTGQVYRLPSEAEWEYAARAGTTSAYYWGDGKGEGNTVCESCGSDWDNRRSAPVGSFPPNPFGLHDMLGNAWEWTEDCWNPGYAGAPSDGAPWLVGDCDGRVLRGGAWFSFPRNIRSAIRMRGVIDNRYLSKGFRVVRVL